MDYWKNNSSRYLNFCRINLNFRLCVNFLSQCFSVSSSQINPVHTVPTLDDNGVIIWDSHAILIYLVDKYAKNDSLYPKDFVKRTIVNQLLFLETSIFNKLIGVLKQIFFGKENEITDSQKESIVDSFESIERILEGKKFLGGQEVTIADISLLTTLTAGDVVDLKKFTKIAYWLKNMEALPFFESNASAIKIDAKVIKTYTSL
ncbi:hypothetical protein HHI36_020498 [Cryptolaemus montrouzieri]|uniref:Glutathione S-transferase n=1 Tax=Cryptolaemus montrouzieri TaxID=559131 RepID=A0ABD2NAW1_9CUCU